MTVLHCDECGKELGTYLYGKGGVEERAAISGGNAISLPDITCFECLRRETPIGVIEEYQHRKKKEHYYAKQNYDKNK